jgi:DNA ligase-1
MTDTLDLVPIAGFIGKGAKTSYFNSFLMAAYNKLDNTYIGVCKLGTGFNHEQIESINKRLLPYLIHSKPVNYIIPASLKPRYYIKPKEVWEIGFDIFSESNIYSLGRGILNKENPTVGLSVRFPRFVKVREDKTLHDANSPEFILELYNKNKNK